MNILWIFFQEETWYGPFGESDEEEKTDKEDAWVIKVTDDDDDIDNNDDDDDDESSLMLMMMPESSRSTMIKKIRWKRYKLYLSGNENESW